MINRAAIFLSAATALLLANPVATSAAPKAHGARLSFNRDIRPILAEACFTCHGFDAGSRKAGLRLDQRESALKGGKSSRPALVPGRPEESEVIQRLLSHDKDEAMPPPSTGKKLKKEQIAVLRRWIAEGAEYEGHWAFIKPTLPEAPPVRSRVASEANPVDSFIRARLAREKLAPSPEADRRTLIRRLSLDLLGLPPSPDEVGIFVGDKEPKAYERLVDRLLASPHFGERWGRHWLDLARYADSDGYEKDAPRPYAWLYRDWVINAVNRDVPFDQFTIQQLAGDLLPEATEAQRVATGFHRQTLVNKEGGVDQEEFRCKATVDRAHTTGAVWLGLTVGCAECHDHKFDPITQREFFQFYAFFNNASDKELPVPTEADFAAHTKATNAWQERLYELTSQLAALAPEPDNAPKANEDATDAGSAADISDGDETAKPPATNQVAKLKAELVKHRKAKPAFKPTAALVLGSDARDTFIHTRGDFLQKGERVQPGGLAALHPFSTRGNSPDRLDLARWLVSPENPLTARVTVNHVWRQLFGRGLVATENDFGARGEPPSHPELLDWLAVNFIATTNAPFGFGQSRKALIRLLVTSGTYKQSSAWRADVAERDPLNALLARQSRYRVEAEAVRDIALVTSGLFNPKIGGPSFKPPLPADLAKLSYANGLKWDAASGVERHRRGLYIHFQRTVPYPMLMAFDAPESNTTCTRRERSNSPLQALTLLNNETFVECAQALGRRISANAKDVESRLRHGFQLATSRPPTKGEFARLKDFWRHHQERFHTDHDATCVAYARVLLNLDETITRQ